MRDDKALALYNLLSVLLVLGVNYASQARLWGAPTIGEISRKIQTMITPASYAFAIWGLIFAGLLAFSLYGFYRVLRYKQAPAFLRQSSPWFVLANLCNAAWVWVFTQEWFGLSVLVMAGLLFSLIQLIGKLDMERWDAPIGTLVFVWWPISLYAGWITVATVVNISLFLKSVGWAGAPLDPGSWVVVMVLVTTALNAYLVFSRNLREFAAVGIWALVAIGLRQEVETPYLAYTAWGCAAVLAVLILWHGYRNRATNPLVKLQQRFAAGPSASGRA